MRIIILLLCLVLLPLYSAIPAVKTKRDAEVEETKPSSSDKTEDPEAEEPKTEEHTDSTTKKPSGGIFDDLTEGVQSITDNFGQVFNGNGSPNFLNNATSWFTKFPLFG